jgi:hypothetical protein
MNTSNLLKGVFACTVLVAGFGVGAANAQGNSDASTVVSKSSEASTGYGGVSDSHGERSSVPVRSGYNTGRTEMPNVPGCVGPVSFCNLYAGS